MKNVLRTLIYDGQVSLTLADTTQIVATGKTLHKLSVSSTKLFGQALSAMTFMSACLKNEAGEISLSLKEESTCGEIAVSGNHALNLRGYIGNVAMEEAFLSANGSLTIIRDDGYSRPFVGSCALPETGGVDEAFEEYYRISEQLPTRIKTSVDISENGECDFAGVVVLQPLPFADEQTQKMVQECDLEALLATLKEKGIEATAKAYFETDETVWETKKAQYKCNCSREYLKGVLVSVGEKQLRQIIREDVAVKVHCHYCNTDYEFTEADADEMFAKE